MPNWCMNSVTITTQDKQTLDAIVEAAKESRLLEYLAPIGEWDYGTATETWGTKWEPQGIDWEVDYESLEVSLNFDSAWGPPIEAYIKAEDVLGVSVYAEYFEPGMAFIGRYDDREDECYTYDIEDETSKEDIPVDLQDSWNLEYEFENYREMMEEEGEDQ